MGSESGSRERMVRRIRGLLTRRGSPRFFMALLLGATGLAGFLGSVWLHALGVNHMAVRYPLAVGLAYLVFLLLLSLWLVRLRARRAGGGTGGGDPVYLDVGVLDPPLPRDVVPASTGGSGSSGGGGGGFKLDLGDGDGLAVVVVLLIVLAVVAALLASLYVLLEAPVLLAEVVADGVLLAGLARRLRPRPGTHWTVGVLRRTWLPAAVTAGAFTLVGLLLTWAVPGAETMGDALRGAAK